MTIRFGEATELAAQIVSDFMTKSPSSAARVVLVRDVLGRLRVLIEGEIAEHAVLDVRLREVTGPYYGGDAIFAKDLIAPEAFFESPDLRQIQRVALLDRVITGADWTHGPIEGASPQPPRATLYGMKGGVGRSTALCVWARHMAKAGQRVLVIDLDLESPGISSSLIHEDLLPDFGVVDWLVEDAVSNVDEEMVRLMVGRSGLASGTSGEILVAPCGGRISRAFGARNSEAGTYMDKLARAYVDVPATNESGRRGFAERLALMIDELEKHHTPDVVLLDSRAGLHDIASVAISRLNAMVFMFAVASRQTWSGYQTLLSHWRRSPKVAQEIRERIKIVAAQVPETDREAFRSKFLQDSYDLFADTLYEESGPENPEAFNFDITATEAPHYPLFINWSRAMQDWDPLGRAVSDDELAACFGDFLTGATDLVLSLEEEDGAAGRE